MTLVATVAGIEEDQHVRLNAFGLQSNADGTVGFGGIVFDDSAGALTINGWQEVIVRETDCTDAPYLFRGWIADRTYSRSGSDARYKITSSRFIDCNLVDPNGALAIRLFVNATAKRPAETDIRRINWLLGPADPGGLSGLVADLGLVDRSSPRPFEDADYRGAYAIDVLNDLAGPLGRIFFVYVNRIDGALGLFYDFPTSTVNTSLITISNVYSDILADTTGNTVAPYMDATLYRDPSEVVSVVRFVYRNGVVLEGNTTTGTTFFSAAATGGLNLINRGIATSNDRVGLEATARIMADGILSKNSVEQDTITCTIQLPSTKAGWVDVGQRVGVRFSHLPGYETLTYLRVKSRTIQHSQGTNLFYDVTLVLSNIGLHSNGGGGSTGPGDFPHPPTGPISIIQSSVGLSTRTMPLPIADGDVLVLVGSKRSTVVIWNPPYTYVDSGEGDVTGGSDYVKGAYIASASSAAQTMTATTLDEADGWYEITAGATLTSTESATGSGYTASTAAISIPAGGIAFAVAGIGTGGGFDAGPGYSHAWTPAAGWVEDFDSKVFDGHPASWIGYYQNLTSAAVSITPSLAFLNDGAGPWPWQMIVMVFGSSTSSIPPTPGQDVPWEVVAMTTLNGVSTGTTLHPYADRSLLVKVDGVLISTASYTETDGSCGDFALSWIVDSSEVVTVKYIGR